jgi:formylglycine-generating enzyme required for sulfatase activity
MRKLRPLLALALILPAGCARETAPPKAEAKPAPCVTAAVVPAPAPDKGGVFTQGAAPQRPEEGPPRETRVDSFWIDRTEVTNAQFARFVSATGYVTLAERPLDPKAYPTLSGDQLKPSAIVFMGDRPEAIRNGWWQVVQGANWREPEGPGSSIAGKENHPVVQIAYDDALAYARWLGRDLPTEAEWEYAARGGLKGAAYSWGDQPLDMNKPQANVWQGPFPEVDAGADGYKAETAPVGCFPANGYGLHDMAGNVWEWTKDWYRPNLDPTQIANPAGPPRDRAFTPASPDEKRRVIKGGSFLCADNFCFRYRPPARESGVTDTGSDHTGFRTVLREN